MKNRKFALEPLTVLEVSARELVNIGAEAGYEYVSIFAHSPMPGMPVDKAVSDLAERRELKSQLASTGVGVLNLECFNLLPDVDAASFAPALEFGGDVGASHATAIVLENSIRSDALTKYQRACDMAAEHGIQVNIEFFAGCRSMPDLRAAVSFVRDAARSNAGVVLDLLHIMRTSGGMPALANLDPELIGTIQLNDGPLDTTGVDLQAEMMERGVPGEGEFPIAAFLEWLPADRVIGLEVAQTSLIGKVPPLERARTIITAARRFME